MSLRSERDPGRWPPEERWQVLMENVKDFAIFMLDAEGKIATWNEGAERILGYTEAEILGQDFKEIFTPEDIGLQQPAAELETAMKSGRAEDERWHLRKDGTRFWAAGLDRSRGGLGIGLTIVQRIAQMHGGRVDAASEGVGRGSEFTLRLPVVADVGAEDESAANKGPQAGETRRILIAEDNQDSAATLGLFLRKLGHDVRIVHDGASAIQAALASVPDAILLDIGLPVLDGYEVAKRIGQHEVLRHCTLIAVTGYGTSLDVDTLLSSCFIPMTPISSWQYHPALRSSWWTLPPALHPTSSRGFVSDLGMQFNECPGVTFNASLALGALRRGRPALDSDPAATSSEDGRS